MSSLSVHNDGQVDQYCTEGAVNINNGNDDAGNDVVSNQVFGNKKNQIFDDDDDDHHHHQFFILRYLGLEAETTVKRGRRKGAWENVIDAEIYFLKLCLTVII